MILLLLIVIIVLDCRTRRLQRELEDLQMQIDEADLDLAVLMRARHNG